MQLTVISLSHSLDPLLAYPSTLWGSYNNIIGGFFSLFCKTNNKLIVVWKTNVSGNCLNTGATAKLKIVYWIK